MFVICLELFVVFVKREEKREKDMKFEIRDLVFVCCMFKREVEQEIFIWLFLLRERKGVGKGPTNKEHYSRY